MPKEEFKSVILCGKGNFFNVYLDAVSLNGDWYAEKRISDTLNSRQFSFTHNLDGALGLPDAPFCNESDIFEFTVNLSYFSCVELGFGVPVLEGDDVQVHLLYHDIKGNAPCTSDPIKLSIEVRRQDDSIKPVCILEEEGSCVIQ